MGRSRQVRPERLAEKLKEIRLKLDLTQPQIFELLDDKKTPLYVGQISLFESGQRVPSLLTLLKYARVAKVPMEVLIDDELNLPDKFTKSIS
jgi:transcriptional regulator with XRE-family HTH domain